MTVPSQINSNQKFHTTLLDSVEKNVKASESRSKYYQRIATITALASIAIGAAVFCALFFLSASSPLPFFLFGLTLSLPFLGVFHKKFLYQAYRYDSLAEKEKGVLRELKQLETLPSEKIEEMLKSIGIEKDQIPYDSLKKLNSREPLKALLPVIARIRYCAFHAEKIKAKALEMIFQKTTTAKTLLNLRQQGWNLLEREAFPSLLESALLCHILTHPECRDTLSDIGELHIRSLEERLSLNFFDGQNTYFAFNDGKKQEISFDKVFNMAPKDPNSLQELSSHLFAKT
jgi:hypothetical protein